MRLLEMKYPTLLTFVLYNRAHSLALPSARRSIHRPISIDSRPRFSLPATGNAIDEDPIFDDSLDDAPAIEMTEAEIEVIARTLKKTVDLPFIPTFLEKQVFKTSIAAFCKAAPGVFPRDTFLQLVSGKKKWAVVKKDVIQELNDAICIPIISREVQDKIVDGICDIMFTRKAMRRKMVGKALQTTLNMDSEEEFATMLNGIIDIPFMNEEQEQRVILKLARRINNTFETMVPESVRTMLKRSSPEDLREVRLNLIDRMNEKIDIPFKNEEEERVYFVAIVDFFFKRYGIDQGTKLPEEELEEVNKELEILEVELEAQEITYKNTMEELNGRKETLLAKKEELQELCQE